MSLRAAGWRSFRSTLCFTCHPSSCWKKEVLGEGSGSPGRRPMELEAPSWLNKRGSDGEEREAKQARAVAVAEKAAGKEGGKDVLAELVMVLGSLALSSAAELRLLTGASFVTFLLPGDLDVTKACLDAGKEYFDEVQKLREQKEDKGDSDEETREKMEKQGSPHVKVALAGLLKIFGGEKLPLEGREKLRAWWSMLCEGGEEKVAREIPVWKCRKPQKTNEKANKRKKHPAQYAKLTFSIKNQEVEELVARALEVLGGQRKVGPPPRSTLEREASKILDKVRKQRSKK